MRLDSCQGRVESQFSDRNAHAVSSQIAQTKNAFTVCYDNSTNILFGPMKKEQRLITEEKRYAKIIERTSYGASSKCGPCREC